MNVIRFPDQNTLSTRVKQIRNPQKGISGVFLFTLRIYHFSIILELFLQKINEKKDQLRSLYLDFIKYL